MDGARLYPNINHFTLAKELPSAKVGDMVGICDADGRECLFVNGIEMTIDYAEKYPEWFNPVSNEEHRINCKENTILHFMSDEFNLTREDAEKAERLMFIK